MNNPVEVAIIGGGAAGLNLALLLRKAGISFELLEAGEHLGGRVLTVDASGGVSKDGFDLGPSWFWPRMQQALGELVLDLGLESYPQSSEGDVIWERMSREPARRYRPSSDAPSESMRLVGGSAALVRALSQDLDHVHLGARATGLTLQDDSIAVTWAGEHSEETLMAQHVVLALPPRLAGAGIAFSPSLERETTDLWRDTPTWMAAQAKFFAVYDEPFWLEAGLSGTAQSMVGPMLEIHDATTPSGSAALFGFLGVGAAERKGMGIDALAKSCVDQLVRLFGEQAAHPSATIIKDWAADPLTATPLDVVSGGHPVPAPRWVHGAWSHRLLVAGSEVSPHEAGYLAGAVEASNLAATELIRRLRNP